jgi:hypothetical protein
LGGIEHVGEVACETPLDAGLEASRTRALCTWAIEAAATASPNAMNTVSIGEPNAASSAATAVARSAGAMRSCSFSSSEATLAPTMSGRVARNWPSLT